MRCISYCLKSSTIEHLCLHPPQRQKNDICHVVVEVEGINCVALMGGKEVAKSLDSVMALWTNGQST